MFLYVALGESMSSKTLRLRPERSPALDQAENRLIEAGLDLFSRYSFDGVTTRMLADRAKTNSAAIQYYFGSKKGLYHAVARHIVEQVWIWLRPTISEIEQTLEVDGLSGEDCIALLCTLLDHSITGLLGSPDAAKWLGILVREEMEPTGAFDIIYDGLVSPIHSCLRPLVARIFGLSPDAQETKLRAYAITGPALIFHVFLTDVRRTLNWKGYGPDEIEAVRRVVIEHVRAALTTARVCLPADADHEMTQ
jgi:TetR/AcrR family transcriptional regulator, regulator of cefoperazone and chloramphenicol sensitivity